MKNSSSTLFLAIRFLALLLFIPTVGHSLTYVKISDETLADRAEVIAEARVLGVDPSPGAEGPVTDYLMAVEHVIHGEVVASPLTVRVRGGIMPDGVGLHIPGTPSFVEDQRALLFLRSRPDGTYKVLHYFLGAFHLAEGDGQSFALRGGSEVNEVDLPGRVPPRDGPRDLDRFRAWLEDRSRGVHRPADYFIEDDERLAAAFNKFTILIWRSGNRLKIRWNVFDTGGGVSFQAHQDGQPGLSGGGFAQVRTALAVWRADPNTPINYSYGGTTATIGTGLGDGASGDGRNIILFDDLATPSSFDEPFNCTEGGVIAVGGPWFAGTHTHNGETFNTALNGDVVTNKGIDCRFPPPSGSPYISQNRRAEEVFAHELGHTLGLGHSCGDDFSPSCSSSGVLNNALMRATIHGDGRGAVLNSDDRAGIRFLYGETLTPPAAPSNLNANTVSNSQINLSWNDNSSDEESFDLERRTGGDSYQPLAQPAANQTAYQDTTVLPGLTYTYRIRALNDAGNSGFSNPATASTPGISAPTGLDAFSVSDSQIRLFWTDESAMETGFEIEYKIGGGPFVFSQSVPANTETTDITGLNAVTTYTFRVRALDTAGTSGYSNEASTTTFYSNPEACVAGANALCLNDGRFKVEVTWVDYQDRTGLGTDAGLTSTDSGLFYFFSPNNWEMLVKVLDACASDTRHFWVFAAATTDVAYDLTVTDSVSGFSKVYSNELGTAAPAIIDTSAFPTCFAENPAISPPVTAPPPAARFESKGGCVPSDTRFCFNEGRYLVELEWRDFFGNTGFGRVDPLQSPDSGMMWFTDPQNLEVLVKVLNGCPENGYTWVFAAATTNLEYTLRVTDTVTDVTREYSNELGNPADTINDTLAFECQ